MSHIFKISALIQTRQRRFGWVFTFQCLNTGALVTANNVNPLLLEFLSLLINFADVLNTLLELLRIFQFVW